MKKYQQTQTQRITKASINKMKMFKKDTLANREGKKNTVNING